jgi:hypothetical protein
MFHGSSTVINLVFLLIYFSKFECTINQPISVPNFVRKVNHVNVLISSCLQNQCSLNFGLGGLGGGGCRPQALPPLGVSLYSSDWSFRPRKIPNSLTYHSARIGDTTKCLHALSPPIPGSILETGALEVETFYLNPYTEIVFVKIRLGKSTSSLLTSRFPLRPPE